MKRYIKVLSAVAALALSGSLYATMEGGKHDLDTNAGSKAGGQDLCRFCHTPHNANATPAALWDRTAPSTASFTVYSSTTMDNAMPQPSGISAACLSCHDGVTALDSLTGITPTVSNTMGDLSYSTGSAILGADLGNDHPIGMIVPVTSEFKTEATILATSVKLYGSGTDVVECASCHDPHEDVLTYFLRVDNAGGTLCQTCHNK